VGLAKVYQEQLICCPSRLGYFQESLIFGYNEWVTPTQGASMKFLKSLKPGIILIFIAAFFSACSLVSIQFTPTQTATAQIAPTQQPTAEQATGKPQPVEVKLPKGIFVNTNDGIGITYYNLLGQIITELKTPGATFAGPSHVHIAGNMPSGPIQVPVVYASYQPEEALMVNINDEVVTLVKTTYFNKLAGAPGLSAMAYSVNNPSDNMVESKLFAGNLQTLPGAAPIVTEANDQALVVVPMAVDATADTIHGVWFSRSPWGIGGDIIFAIEQGLYYYDMATAQVTEYLNETHRVQGLALDRRYAASMSGGQNEPLTLRVINLSNGTIRDLPLDATSDRGGGDASFSPDNNFVAWMEASGTHMAEVPNFRSRIRVTQLPNASGLIHDILDTAVAALLGSSSVTHLKPVGWLDNQTLLIEARQESWEDVALVKLDVTTGGLSIFCQGSFVGFAYES